MGVPDSVVVGLSVFGGTFAMFVLCAVCRYSRKRGVARVTIAAGDGTITGTPRVIPGGYDPRGMPVVRQFGPYRVDDEWIDRDEEDESDEENAERSQRDTVERSARGAPPMPSGRQASSRAAPSGPPGTQRGAGKEMGQASFRRYDPGSSRVETGRPHHVPPPSDRMPPRGAMAPQEISIDMAATRGRYRADQYEDPSVYERTWYADDLPQPSTQVGPGGGARAPGGTTFDLRDDAQRGRVEDTWGYEVEGQMQGGEPYGYDQEQSSVREVMHAAYPSARREEPPEDYEQYRQSWV